MSDAFAALPAPLAEAVRDLGYTAPTPIQASALPVLFGGVDLLGQARTGSGKTAAFALPLLSRIDLTTREVQALVLVPTRELADQVVGAVRALGKRMPGLRVVATVGGQPRIFQSRTLGEGAHVVVGTPGRTLDLLQRGDLALGRVVVLVLDEADRMLELGFADEMEAIRDHLPDDRQTVLFSATLPPAIPELSASWQRTPTFVKVDEVQRDTVERTAAIEPEERIAALATLLRAVRPTSALVFCNRKRTVDQVAQSLAAAGFDAAPLHGDLDTRDRDRVLARFRLGAVRVLVASDVAARGLDLEGLDLVVNLSVAERPEDHIHRVGRTGRAGQPGLAWTFVNPGEPATDTLPEPQGPPLRAEWAALEVGAGRADKLRPGDLLGALTGTCALPGAAVGRIEIGDRRTFVALAPDHADEAVRGLGRHGVKRLRVRVERI